MFDIITHWPVKTYNLQYATPNLSHAAAQREKQQKYSFLQDVGEQQML